MDFLTISNDYSIPSMETLINFSLLCRRISDVLPHFSDIHAIPPKTNGIGYTIIYKLFYVGYSAVLSLDIISSWQDWGSNI